jgi:hypothetical protein
MPSFSVIPTSYKFLQDVPLHLAKFAKARDCETVEEINNMIIVDLLPWLNGPHACDNPLNYRS